MKNIIKLLVLGAMTVGALVGCDDKGSKPISRDSSSSPLSSISSSSSAPQASDSYHSLTSSDITSSIASSVVPTIIGITLNTDKVKKEYKYAEPLDLTGLVVTANYSDGTSVAVNNYTTNIRNGDYLIISGVYNIIVSYERFNAYFSVTVANELTKITINTDEVKKYYTTGDKLDLSGLEVTAVYDDGTTEVVTDYSTYPVNGTTLNDYGTQGVAVTYKQFNATFEIFVKAPKTLNVDTSKAKLVYEQGEQFSTSGLSVSVTYTDGTVESQNNFTTNPADGAVLNEIGTFDVTVTAKNLTAKYQITVNTPSKKNWTVEEAKIMSDNLHGVVLPFTGKEESVVGYDQETKCVVIKGGEFTADELTAYGNAYISDGYKKVNSNAHVYEKSVETADGIRFVRASFTLDNKSLYLEAYNPYYYEFPTFFAEELASLGFGSTVVPPSFDADYYEISERNAAIYAYTNTDGTSTYTVALTTANWNVLEGVDANEFKTAISPDGLYAVKYLYNTQEKSLDIYFGPVNFWNKAVVEAFYNKYNGYVVDIPAFNLDNAEYVFIESDLNESAYAYGALEVIHAFMKIYGPKASDVSQYVTILTNAGWEVSQDGNLYQATLLIPDHGIARIEFEFNSKENAIVVTIYFKLDAIPSTEWPLEQLNEALGYYVGTIPAFTGNNNGFVVLNDMFGVAVMVKVTKGTEEAAIASYANDLTNGGYVYNESSNNYTCPNSEIIIEVYSAENGSITIAFSRGSLGVFPSSLISDYFDGTDEVPTVSDASSYSYSIISETEINITCTYSSSSNATKGRNNYSASLVTLGYEKNNYTFTSPNQHFTLTLSVSGKQLVISVKGTPKQAFVSLWPTTQINTLFTAEGYTDPLPSYDDVCTDITAGKNYDGSIYVLIETDDKDNVATAYCGLLAIANFTYDLATSDQYVNTYKSPNNQYSVGVETNRFGVSLTIKNLGGSSQGDANFPMTQLIADVPSAEGKMPTFDFQADEYSYDYYFGEAFITITYTDKALAATKCQQYIQALGNSNFTYEKLWSYLDAYVAPDRLFAIEVLDADLTNGIIQLGIMDLTNM